MKNVLLRILCTLLPSIALAASPTGVTRYLSEDDGLSSNHVWCCFQDSRGYIWIGTDAGLDRYDGIHIRSFTHSTRCIAETDGTIWAGTEQGLYTYSMADGLLSLFPEVTEYGVNIISRINDITVTDENVLWVGTEGQGLFRYIIQEGKLTQHSVHTPFVETIQIDPDGRIIITDRDNKVHQYSPDGEYLRPLNRSMEKKDPVFTDMEGTRWIPTTDNGVLIIPAANSDLTVYPFPFSISSSTYIPLSEDNDGNIIIGLKEKVYKLIPEEEQFRLIGNIAPHGQVTHLLNTPEGLWIGTDTDCICRYVSQSDNTHHYHTGGKTNVLYRTQEGEFMAGTNLGVFSWNAENDRLAKDLNRRDIQILIDGKKPKNSSLPKEFEVVSQSAVVAMCEDASGHYLYLATSNRGIFRKNLITKGWEHILTSGSGPNSLPWDKLTTLLCCSDGTIWAGTDGEGLWVMIPDALSFRHASTSDPRLHNSKISGITEDGAGKLWICSTSGLWRMDPGSGSSERIPVRAESILYATDGRLYIGNRDGVVAMQPPSKNPAPQWPRTVIQEISFGDSTVYVPPGGRSLILKYPNNSFDISIAALSYADPSQNLYSWCLSGIDSDWSSPGTISTASYKKVRPGEYIFHVRGSEDTVKISVRPPWWGTKWAVSLYILLGASILVFLLLYWQSKIKHRYNEMMKRQEEEREKALYKQRIRFFMGLVHEIRTPLTLIRLQHDKDAPGKTDTITRNLDYMQETINKILTYDKNTSGDIRMLKTRLNLNDVVLSVTDTFRESAALESIIIEVVTEQESVIVNADEDMLTKILTNLLSNAIKYTKDRISVTVGAEDAQAIVTVADNGPGVKMDQREKIFGMFYTAPDDKIAEASGIGVGLAYARQLAVAHDGSLTVEDAVPCGASFVLKLPLLAEQSSSSETLPIPLAPSKERLTVLVVEDNRELRQTLKTDLSEWYDVLTAPDGGVALKLIEDKAVDVVVSDVMMPVVDGFELCRRIKGQLAYSHIPVILLTAKVTLDAKSEGLESGADAYVEKPFAIRQLKSQIDNLIRLRETFRRVISGNGTAEEEVPAGAEADFIRGINESIEKQLSEESFSIEALAYDMAMSRTNFFRKFKALTGMTPNDYLKNYRLDRAASLIKGGARINEAAESVGFTSSSYFAKCFKARFGVLPKDYAKT